MFSLIDVGPGREEKFIQFFKEAQAFLAKQPGFIENRLFRSQNPNSPSSFMVVGKWDSGESLRAAAMSEDWKKLMSGLPIALRPTPFEEVSL